MLGHVVERVVAAERRDELGVHAVLERVVAPPEPALHRSRRDLLVELHLDRHVPALVVDFHLVAVFDALGFGVGGVHAPCRVPAGKIGHHGVVGEHGLHEEALAAAEEVVLPLRRAASQAHRRGRLERLAVRRNLGADGKQPLAVELQALRGRVERKPHERIPVHRRRRRAHELLLLQALVGERRLDAGDHRPLRVKAHRDPLLRRLVEVLAQAHALRELAVEERRVLRLALRLDGRFLQHDMVVSGRRHELIALERHAVGQHVVGVLARVGHPDVHVYDELHLREDLVDPKPAVRAVVHGVAGDDPERLDGIGLLAFHLVDELVLAQHLRFVALAAKRHGDGRVVEDHREARRQHLARDARARASEVAGQHAEQVERAVAFALVLIAKPERAEDVGVRGVYVLVG